MNKYPNWDRCVGRLVTTDRFSSPSVIARTHSYLFYQLLSWMQRVWKKLHIVWVLTGSIFPISLFFVPFELFRNLLTNRMYVTAWWRCIDALTCTYVQHYSLLALLWCVVFRFARSIFFLRSVVLFFIQTSSTFMRIGNQLVGAVVWMIISYTRHFGVLIAVYYFSISMLLVSKT